MTILNDIVIITPDLSDKVKSLKLDKERKWTLAQAIPVTGEQDANWDQIYKKEKRSEHMALEVYLVTPKRSGNIPMIN